MTALAPDRSLGFWAKCRACAHCWIAAYYPANLTDFAKVAARATCPKCGDRKPMIAKQSNGVLQEDQSNG